MRRRGLQERGADCEGCGTGPIRDRRRRPPCCEPSPSTSPLAPPSPPGERHHETPSSPPALPLSPPLRHSAPLAHPSPHRSLTNETSPTKTTQAHPPARSTNPKIHTNCLITTKPLENLPSSQLTPTSRKSFDQKLAPEVAKEVGKGIQPVDRNSFRSAGSALYKRRTQYTGTLYRCRHAPHLHMKRRSSDWVYVYPRQVCAIRGLQARILGVGELEVQER